MAAHEPNYTTDGIFRRIAEATARTSGHAFLRALLAPLTETLGVRYAFVSEFIDGARHARVIAWWDGREYSADLVYALAGTPCEAVLDGEIHCFPTQVAARFPHEHALLELGIESYMAIPLCDAQGTVLGHLAIMDTQPMREDPAARDVFRVFGAMAGTALERQRFEEALRASEARLAQVLASAPDAIVTLDDALRVASFNPAALRIFDCSAEALGGCAFDTLLTPPLAAQLREQLGALPAGTTAWSPPGHAARRADGTTFPVEYTVARLDAAGARGCVLMLRDVAERERALAEIADLEQTRRFLLHEARAGSNDGFVARAPAMQALWRDVAAIAQADSTVLVIGETGSGKERIVHAIHQQSRRADGMLVKMNCAALPAELIESELFGHEKGAFTGATSQRKGRFELADKGTLFLDEVGELTLAAQAKLLRVLQEQEFERVGGSAPIRVDVRVVAATNRDLETMVKRGEFRADLYYRLHVLPLRVPPLRERREDIAPLARHFLALNARKLGRALEDFDAASWAWIDAYDWPGNVRELQNVVERAAVLATGPLATLQESTRPPPPREAAASAAPTTLASVEAAHLREVLGRTGWVIEGPRGAAALLGLEPSTLRSRLRKLGISRPRQSRDPA